MDAPQLPDAGASANPVGGPPPGQASAFRRALDSQVEPPEPSKALVPTGPHDLTVPIDVDIDVLRALFASGKPSAPNAPPTPFASNPAMPVPAPAPMGGGIPPTAPPAPPPPVFPLPTAQPSASGPTVVMPSVSVPALRAPTTIAQAANNAPAAPDAAPIEVRAEADGSRGERSPAAESSPRHGGGKSKTSRLSTTVGVSAVLAAIAAAALVLLDVGRSSDPLAPTAMPTKATTHNPTPHPSHPAAPPPKVGPSPSPIHSSAGPSHSPSPSVTVSPSRSAGPSPSTVPSFSTIYWTSSVDPRVVDIQRRLDELNYLRRTSDGEYTVTSRTLSRDPGNWRPPSDDPGYYRNATDMAIRAFKFDYLQHGQGQPPPPGCDTRTYQALVNATS